MKKYKKITKSLIAVVVVFTMVFGQVYSTPTEALSIKDIWNRVSDTINNIIKDNHKDNGVDLTLIEDETTVVNGNMLRASTYEAETYAQTTSDNVKYFDTVLFDYDQAKINNETKKLEQTTNRSQYKGLYFDDQGNNAAPHNAWNKGKGSNYPYGAYIYSGLASEIKNGNIQFAGGVDCGIFNAQTSVSGKTVYTGQKLPFEFDKNTKLYTFDSSKMSAIYDSKDAEGYMTYKNTPQNFYDSVGSQETTGFFPLNNSSNIGGYYTTPNYYFGMITTVDFGMTANGRLDASNDESAPIKFDFSGDDDVWVFIDGKLVLDLGGIHDEVYGTIDFSQNKVTYYSASGSNQTLNSGDAGTKNYNQTTGETVTVSVKTGVDGYNNPVYENRSRNVLSQGQIFNTTSETGETIVGKVEKDRATFAAQETHKLAVYYLERGAGASNCKIQFNLPVKDSVNVTKKLDDVLYDKTIGKPTSNKLSSEDKASLANRDFTFTLYKNGEAVKNASYSLYGSNGNYLSDNKTTSNGTFTLKYGQTAKFWTVLNGEEYYVIENNLGSSWKNPNWVSNIDAVNNNSQSVSTNNSYESNKVTVTGSDESSDTIMFDCTNALYNPAVDIAKDEIVIDYGLPVNINPLRNDTASAGKLVITGISKTEAGGFAKTVDGEFGAFILKNDGTIDYQLNSMKMNKADKIYYQVAYTTNPNKPIGTAEVSVYPATSIYFEEDFGSITYKGNWKPEGIKKPNSYQENGIVGDNSDSCYGSDVIYKNNQGDSLGTSMFVDTTNGAASFTYEFTGTGTAIFARTSNTSGYIRIVVKQDNETISTWIRDTRYLDGTETGNVLYNIRVYTWQASDYLDNPYGTYTVEVTVAKKTIYGYEFNLDGIRVFESADLGDSNYNSIESAYNQDLEAEMSKITLWDQMIGETVETEDGGLKWQPGNIVFTDSNGQIQDPETFMKIGPKDEVYLSNRQTINFTIKNWYDEKGVSLAGDNARIYLAAKVPFNGEKTLLVNGRELKLSSTVDCYYDITEFVKKDGTSAKFEISNSSNGIISLTYLKVAGYAEAVLGENINGDKGAE